MPRAGIALLSLLLIGCAFANAMLGGFSPIANAANDANVEKAKGVAMQGLSAKGLKGPLKVEVLSAESQVVAGTNYRLKLRVQDAQQDTKYFQATVWEKLPAYGGEMELSSLEEISADAAGASSHTQQQVPAANPGVEGAVAFAVEQLSQQSNSLYAFTLKKIVAATSKTSANGEEVTYHLKLRLQQGDMPEQTFEVEVAHKKEGAYSLQSSQVAAG